LLVVLQQPHTQEAAAGVLDQLDLWELKQLKQGMVVRGKFLQSQVLVCSTQGVAEVEQTLTEQHLVVQVAVETVRMQGQCRLVEPQHKQTQVAVAVAALQQRYSLKATAALESSSFVTLHHKAHQRHLAVQTHPK
jgi:hypothetical protein